MWESGGSSGDGNGFKSLDFKPIWCRSDDSSHG